MRDVNQRYLDFFIGAIEIEIELRELASAEFAVDPDPRMDFFARVAVGLEADFRLEQLDLGGSICRSRCGVGLSRLGRLRLRRRRGRLRRVLSARWQRSGRK